MAASGCKIRRCFRCCTIEGGCDGRQSIIRKEGSLSPGKRPESSLLRHILHRVSRSFYLSLSVLTPAVRPQVSLSYLFCRLADTIADTGMLPRHQRLESLENFRYQFLTETPDHEALCQLQDLPLPQHGTEGERQLIHHLPECFGVFLSFPSADQQLIRALVLTLTRGMEMDLKCFPGETAAEVVALPNMPALDVYTYYVAGVVGEFWTKIHAVHVPAFQRIDVPAMCRLAVSFGKGLQLTNILKDVGKDVHNGRCYLPEDHLEQLQVRVGDLQEPATLHRLRPLLRTLIWDTLVYLDQARAYIEQLPRRAWRLRLSCMWPLLFAVQTLHVVWQSEHLLQPKAAVKISRRAVYTTIFHSLWCLIWPKLFVTYYFCLRRRLTTALGNADASVQGHMHGTIPSHS
ncbi:hypothetical protein NKDENANG_00407 [Candidatus Entotheonellaceae bacterium PAL068K]